MATTPRMVAWRKRQRENGLRPVEIWIPEKEKSVIREAAKRMVVACGEAGNQFASGVERAMGEVPPPAAQHLPVPRGARSFHSENHIQPDGFWQSTEEFKLDIAPRTKDELLTLIRDVDESVIEPETAEFLRGFMLGEIHDFTTTRGAE